MNNDPSHSSPEAPKSEPPNDSPECNETEDMQRAVRDEVAQRFKSAIPQMRRRWLIALLTIGATIFTIVGGLLSWSLKHAAQESASRAVKARFADLDQQITRLHEQADNAIGDVREEQVRGESAISTATANVQHSASDARVKISNEQANVSNHAQSTKTIMDERGRTVMNECNRVSKSADDCAQEIREVLQRTLSLSSQLEETEALIKQTLDSQQAWDSVANHLSTMPDFRRHVSGSAFPNLPPIGSIIPYYGELADLPDDGTWIVCDGQPIPQDSPLYANGIRETPDLRERVVRGATDARSLGKRGGQNVLKNMSVGDAGAHSHEAHHRHGLPQLTGSISNGGPDPGHHPYLVLDDHGSRWGEDKHLRTDGPPSTTEGQHMHNLGGMTAHAQTKTDKKGMHSHIIPEVNIIPSHTSVFFIMRIR
jgi:vacuolar-type H+-ATPase subunit H